MFATYDPIFSLHYKNVVEQFEVFIPTTDEVAFGYYGDYSWVYFKDKFLASYSDFIEKINFGPPEMPVDYPIIVKPRINLGGGGVGFREVCRFEAEDSLIWMERLTGNHLSHDFVVIGGRVVDCVSFRGFGLGDGTFDYWKYVSTPVDIYLKISKWASKFLSNYSGIFNVETIGGKPIEVQLRMGDIDKFGSVELMESIIKLYKEKVWCPIELSNLYIFAVFGKHGINYSLDVGNILEGCICWQIDEPEYYYQNPPSGVRLALFSVSDFNLGLEIKEKLVFHFQHNNTAQN